MKNTARLDACLADLHTQIRRVFPAGEAAKIDVRILDTDQELGVKTVVLTDIGCGTSITNAAEVYWPWVCEVTGVPFQSMLAIELYYDEDISIHGDVVSFDDQGRPNWRPLTESERAAILACWTAPLSSDAGTVLRGGSRSH